MLEMKEQEMKKLYVGVEVEARLLYCKDVLTASIDDPNKDNDQIQDDGIFG